MNGDSRQSFCNPVEWTENCRRADVVDWLLRHVRLKDPGDKKVDTEEDSTDVYHGEEETDDESTERRLTLERRVGWTVDVVEVGGVIVTDGGQFVWMLVLLLLLLLLLPLLLLNLMLAMMIIHVITASKLNLSISIKIACYNLTVTVVHAVFGIT